MTKAANTVDAHVGAQLRLRRTMLGMSQDKLGEALGLTFQQVQKYEKGANRIGASRLYQIATVLDVSVDYFFEGLAPGAGDPPPPPAPFPLGGAEGLQLHAAFARIESRDLRKRVLELVKALAQDGDELAPAAPPRRAALPQSA